MSFDTGFLTCIWGAAALMNCLQTVNLRVHVCVFSLGRGPIAFIRFVKKSRSHGKEHLLIMLSCKNMNSHYIWLSKLEHNQNTCDQGTMEAN